MSELSALPPEFIAIAALGYNDPDSLRSCADYFNSYIALNGDLDLLLEYQREVETIIADSWSEVEAIAEHLLSVGSLSESDALRSTAVDVFISDSPPTATLEAECP